jgi:hypothetical protein
VYFARVIPQAYPPVEESAKDAVTENDQTELFQEVSAGLGYELQTGQGD